MEESSLENRINEKIEEIERFLSELYDYFYPLDLELEDYKSDYKTKAICERYCEKIVEAIEDLGFLMINKKKLRYPEYDKEVFDILKEKNIISETLCENFKEAKGMRNFIAHQYGKVDDEIVFNSVTEDLEKDTKEFIKSIELNLK